MKLHRLPALLPLLASSLSVGSLLWAASAQAATEPADDAADAQSRCSDLKEVELPDVVIQRVKWVQRGGLAQDPNSAFTGASGQTLQAEEHCVVRGEIEPRTGADGRHYGTQFELRLPARQCACLFGQLRCYGRAGRHLRSSAAVHGSGLWACARTAAVCGAHDAAEDRDLCG